MHRTDLPGVRSSRAALVRVSLGFGSRQGYLTAERCRRQHLHRDLTQGYGETERRDVPSERRHQPEIILQPFSNGAEQALADGADLLVIGRPITGAPDPGAAAASLAAALRR